MRAGGGREVGWGRVREGDGMGGNGGEGEEGGIKG